MRTRSRRTEGLVQSEIRAMTRACTAAGGVNMGQGICDVPTPEFVREAAHRAIHDNRSIYSRFDGDAALREALAWKLETHNGVRYDAETEIVVTNGASGGWAATLMALFDPGDELLVFEPYYGYHIHTARVAGVTPVLVPLSAPDFALDLEAVRARITPRTRGLLINTPCNPSGRVFLRDELEALGSLCEAFDLLVVTDEVYEYMVYPGRSHISMASLPGMRDRTVTIGSYSKTFSITGWRIGFAAASAELAAPIGLANDLFYVCAPTPLQHAVATGIREAPDAYYAEMMASYLRKREQFCDVLDQVGLAPIRPQGAYYVLADVRPLAEPTARDAALRILREAGVAGVAGSAFFDGETGHNYVRFCYAKSAADLDRACDQLLRWRGLA
jgi:aminotransferase